jgi:DnaJ-class molecular chaperone
VTRPLPDSPFRGPAGYRGPVRIAVCRQCQGECTDIVSGLACVRCEGTGLVQRPVRRYLQLQRTREACMASAREAQRHFDPAEGRAVAGVYVRQARLINRELVQVARNQRVIFQPVQGVQS